MTSPSPLPTLPVAVLGLGAMGHGIAQTFAVAGFEVKTYDADAKARATLHSRVRENLSHFVAAELVAPHDVEPILSRIHACDSESAALADVGFVTEAVAEDLPVKQELFSRIESVVGENTILASNSSTFPISQSGARMKHPERAIVTHWFNPPHIVPTVEVVPGPRTTEAVVETTLALLRRIGKLAIPIRKELPGFLVNRIQIAVMREVWDLLDQGVATAEEIDAAVQGSMGFRLAALGPLEIHDFGGLDIQTTVFNNLVGEIQSGTSVPQRVQDLVDAGHYGPKTGKGFYDYSPARLAERKSQRNQRFLQLLKLFHSR